MTECEVLNTKMLKTKGRSQFVQFLSFHAAMTTSKMILGAGH